MEPIKILFNELIIRDLELISLQLSSEIDGEENEGRISLDSFSAKRFEEYRELLRKLQDIIKNDFIMKAVVNSFRRYSEKSGRGSQFIETLSEMFYSKNAPLVSIIQEMPTFDRMLCWKECVQTLSGPMRLRKKDRESLQIINDELDKWLSSNILTKPSKQLNNYENDNQINNQEVKVSSEKDIESDISVHRLPVILNDPRVDESLLRLEKNISQLQGRLDAYGEARQFENRQHLEMHGKLESLSNSLHIDSEKWKDIFSKFTEFDLQGKSEDQSFKKLEDFSEKVIRKIKEERIPMRDVLDWQKTITEELHEIKNTADGVNYLKDELLNAEQRYESISKDLNNLISIHSLGLDFSSIKMRRILPLRVYLSDDDDSIVSEVKNSIDKFVSAFGFAICDEYPDQKGSWFKRLLIKTKEKLTEPQLVARLNKIERTIEVTTLGAAQATIDKAQAEAVSCLINSLEPTSSAVCQVGSVLILKKTDSNGSNVIVRTMTQNEMIYLEQNQQLLHQPDEILLSLSNDGTNNTKLSHIDDKNSNISDSTDKPN